MMTGKRNFIITIKIDMYNGNKKQNADGIRVFFNDCGGGYWGWLYKSNDIIGDFSANDSVEIEKALPHLAINWD